MDGREKRGLAEKIVRRLRDSGFEALFAGGCVRDEIMGSEPADYDIATSAKPAEVTALFERTVPVGAQFGVVLVILGGTSFEVATFRKDSEYEDGRRPSAVTFSSAREDALRRDFTINGLFLDPVTGEVIDYVGGRSDIRGRIIRTIGSPRGRFAEDRLRIIRAVRFAARFGFSMEDGTLAALKENVTALKEVSAERIREELTKMFTGPNPHESLELLKDTGILQVVLPEVSAMQGVRQPDEFHPEGDVFTHTKLMLADLKDPSDVLAFAVLFHDVGKPGTFNVAERIRFDGHVETGVRIADDTCKRLKFSNEKKEKILECIANHMRFKDVQKMRESKLKRFLKQETFLEQLELHRVDCASSHMNLDNYEFCRKKLEEYGEEKLKAPPLLTGHDLISEGFEPGPLFKKILTAVEDAQLEGELEDRESALKFVRENFGPGSAEKRDKDI